MVKPTRQYGASIAVLAYLKQHQHVEVSADDIAADTNLDRTKAVAAIQNLKKTNKIESPHKGWYVYGGPLGNGSMDVVPHKAKAEVVALLNDDRLLITVEGRIGVWQELEVE